MKIYIVMGAGVNSCDFLELEVFGVFSTKEKAEEFYSLKITEQRLGDLHLIIVERTLDFEYTNRKDISYLYERYDTNFAADIINK